MFVCCDEANFLKAKKKIWFLKTTNQTKWSLTIDSIKALSFDCKNSDDNYTELFFKGVC